MTRIANPYDRPEFAARYARARPAPPPDLLALFRDLAGGRRPRLVVDLGCGTGLSTRAWRGRTNRAIGIDSNPNMLRWADAAPGIEYWNRTSTDTGLPTGSVDIVTCAQSLHWMPLRATLREVGRILRRGGVFAAYDYVVPPVVEPRVDRAFTALLRWSGLPALPEETSELPSRLAHSRRFRWTGRGSAHGQEWGDARRALDLALSLAHVAARLPDGEESRDRRWTTFARAVRRSLGRSRRPFWWSYEVVWGVK